ncbi:hypothetical protein LY76DRAFT_266807 [Colletotrichum caudatum]|nr:hypothetical protein LY76DRAFT_266807 [Colletotrichum caudatum]
MPPFASVSLCYVCFLPGLGLRRFATRLQLGTQTPDADCTTCLLQPPPNQTANNVVQAQSERPLSSRLCRLTVHRGWILSSRSQFQTVSRSCPVSGQPTEESQSRRGRLKSSKSNSPPCWTRNREATILVHGTLCLVPSPIPMKQGTNMPRGRQRAQRPLTPFRRCRWSPGGRG